MMPNKKKKKTRIELQRLGDLLLAVACRDENFFDANYKV
jgi:hypothetical protein